MNYSIVSQVIKWLILSLVLMSFIACATPLEKARLQADKDWATAIANAEKYQELRRLMLQGMPPSSAQPVVAPPPARPF